MKSKAKLQDLIINQTYIVKSKISSGSFGEVYLVENILTKQEYAVKMEEVKTNEEECLRSVLRESTLLSKLFEIKGIPKVLYTGSENNYDVLVMDLLGKDLASLLKTYKKFSLKTIILLANQLLPLLEQIHEKNIIHRDIKPENVLMGRAEKSNIVYLLDFGISKYYRDNHGRHIIYRENKPFIGTTRYASISSHKGIELSRRDDLESLGYMFVFLLNGGLPWQNLAINDKEKNKIVGELKEKSINSDLCKNFPKEFNDYFDYVKNLGFKKEPDYNYLRSLFIKMAQDFKYDLNDYSWEWSQNKKESLGIGFLSKRNTEQKEKDKEKDKEKKIKSNEELIEKKQLNQLRSLKEKPMSSIFLEKAQPNEKNNKSKENEKNNYQKSSSNDYFLIPPSEVNRKNYRQPSLTGSIGGSIQTSIDNHYVNSHIYLSNPEEYEDAQEDEMQEYINNNRMEDLLASLEKNKMIIAFKKF